MESNEYKPSPKKRVNWKNVKYLAESIVDNVQDGQPVDLICTARELQQEVLIAVYGDEIIEWLNSEQQKNYPEESEYGGGYATIY